MITTAYPSTVNAGKNSSTAAMETAAVSHTTAPQAAASHNPTAATRSKTAKKTVAVCHGSESRTRSRPSGRRSRDTPPSDRGPWHGQPGHHAQEPTREDVMTLRGVATDEPAVEIVDEIRRAPIEMGQDRRGIRRDQPANHQPRKSHGQKLEHRRIRDVVTHERRIHMGKRALNVGKLGVHSSDASATRIQGHGRST